MIKRTMPTTIRRKIMVCTAAITFLIALLTVSICFTVFQSFLRRNQIRSAEYNLRTVSHNVSVDMDNLIYFSRWCCSNTDIIQYLEGFQTETRMPSISSGQSHLRSLALDAYARLKEEYRNTHPISYISRVIISPENCVNYLQICDTSGSGIPMAASLIRDSSFFRPLMDAPDYKWIGLVEDLYPASDGSLSIPIVRPIYNQYNSQMVGWTHISISDRIIRDYLKAFPLEQDSLLYLNIGGNSYLYKDGIFTSSSPSFTVLRDLGQDTFNQDSQVALIRLADGGQRRMLTCPLGDDGWTMSQILSEQGYNAQNHVYLQIIGAIVVIIGLMGLMLAYILNRTISQPVKKLRDKIDLISQGDFSREPSIEWPDELGDIGRGINLMSENVASLLDKRIEDEKQKKDLEYQILQSQINPHFLYNTLNSIKWMATIQNATGIAQMTTALARLMKNVSKGTTVRIPLKEELDLVADYFLIQQYRYGGSISIEYDIASPDLYRCLIHRFTLQPLVENALFHGIEPKGCAGKIAIRAESRDGRDSGKLLCITVTDNGIGMSAETIAQVLEGDASPSADFFKQVGINNVDKRIKYDFGPGYGITITSVVGEYTSMVITLPYTLPEGEQHD